MAEPVNLANLRSMTDGDPEVEAALFEEFCDSFERGIHVLSENAKTGPVQTWQRQTHALKGIALNLGAEKLGDLCRLAQEHHLDDAENKSAMLNHIQTEYQRVKQFLKAV